MSEKTKNSFKKIHSHTEPLKSKVKLPAVIVVGNEKGGSGKSTVSIHLATSYLYEGLKVATIDLDGRQSTLTHYIENRIKYTEKHEIDLPIPEHLVVTPNFTNDADTQEEDERRLNEEVEELKKEYDVIIIDTPGAYNHLSRAGHRNADVLVTPINDSFIDLDMLAEISDDGKNIVKPSTYAETVWDIKKTKAEKGHKNPFRWVVMRNRVAHINAKNKKEVAGILKNLAPRIGFELISGFGERVIYREMFLKGITVIDIAQKQMKNDMSVSHLAARYELKNLLDIIGIRKS